jgi:hypothetical protein
LSVSQRELRELRLCDLFQPVRNTVRALSRATYDLYSVPAFGVGAPAAMRGSEIPSPKHPVQAGDLLVCQIDLRVSRVWIVHESHPRREKLASTEYLVLQSQDRRLSEYVMWYLRSQRFHAWMTHAVAGSKRISDRVEKTLAAPVPMQPPGLREGIVAACKQRTAHLDRIQDPHRRHREQMEALTDSLWRG